MSGLDTAQQEEYLLKRIDNSNKAIKVSVIGAAIVAIFTMFFIVFQLFSIQEQINQTLIQGQKNAANNHLRTQQYIKCVVLLSPEQRIEENFDKCGKTGTVDPETGAFVPDTNKDESSSTSIGGVTTAPIPPEQSTDPRQQETTSGSSPPSPDAPPQSLIDTLQHGLKGLLNGVESRIDQLERGL